MSPVQIGELAAGATALLWTLSVLFSTYAAERVGTMAVCFIRPVMAFGLLMIYGQTVRGMWLPGDAALRTWCLMGASGLFGFLICDLCLFKATLLIGPRLSVLLYSLSPPIAAVVAWLCIGDTLRLRHWAAMAVTLAGVLWVILEQPYHDDHPRGRPHWKLGVLLGCLSALTNGIGYVFSKNGIGDYDAGAATQVRLVVAISGYVILITLWRRWPAMLAAVRHRRAMGAMTAGAILGPFTGVTLSLIALRLAPTGIVATIIATMPVLILPFSILLHREKVSLRAAVGAVIAVVGVAMLTL
jgi:drug/metabolite transporter (DMT)-like permease